MASKRLVQRFHKIVVNLENERWQGRVNSSGDSISVSHDCNHLRLVDCMLIYSDSNDRRLSFKSKHFNCLTSALTTHRTTPSFHKMISVANSQNGKVGEGD